MTQPLNPTELKRLHRETRRRVEHRFAVGLDGVANPFNVGALYRTAAAFRAAYFALTPQATGPEHAKVKVTAMGCDRFIDTRRVADPLDLVRVGHEEVMQVIAIELARGARPIFDLDLRGDVLFVLGNEDHGCSRGLLEQADSIAYIPQLGKVGSLNVATAGACVMSEWVRHNLTQTE